MGISLCVHLYLDPISGEVQVAWHAWIIKHCLDLYLYVYLLYLSGRWCFGWLMAKKKSRHRCAPVRYLVECHSQKKTGRRNETNSIGISPTTWADGRSGVNVFLLSRQSACVHIIKCALPGKWKNANRRSCQHVALSLVINKNLDADHDKNMAI